MRRFFIAENSKNKKPASQPALFYQKLNQCNFRRGRKIRFS